MFNTLSTLDTTMEKKFLEAKERAAKERAEKAQLQAEAYQKEAEDIKRHLQLLESQKKREDHKKMGVVEVYWDVSSSMNERRGHRTKFDATIEILKTLYEKYEKDPNIQFVLRTFNHKVIQADFPTLCQRYMEGTWKPNGGTALFDTLSSGIRRCREYKAQGYEDVIMLVISDGEEQSSQHFDQYKDPNKLQYQARIQAEITKAGDEDILIKFLLEGQDAMKASQKLGIQSKNLCQTDLTPGTVARSASKAVSEVIAEYCSATAAPQRTKMMRGFTADHKASSMSSAPPSLPPPHVPKRPRRKPMQTCPPRKPMQTCPPRSIRFLDEEMEETALLPVPVFPVGAAAAAAAALPPVPATSVDLPWKNAGGGPRAKTSNQGFKLYKHGTFEGTANTMEDANAACAAWGCQKERGGSQEKYGRGDKGGGGGEWRLVSGGDMKEGEYEF